MPETVDFMVNGVRHTVLGAASRSLLSVLREELDLTGAKPGCGEGECGACTVLVDGKPVRSCTAGVDEARGRSVTTIEGLAADGNLHPVQDAFVEQRAMQCGYCTPGMILSAVALLASEPAPEPERVRAALDGNVCRCGMYSRIERAVRAAVDRPPAPAAGPPRTDLGAHELTRPDVPWDLAEPDARDWFGVLGDGIVVVASASSPDGAWAVTGGAWIHVGAATPITVFTGKVDVGQGTRSALAVVVARALGVDPASVRVVMGDTDLCPFDVGTFGSLSMPTVEPHIRSAALALSRLLLDLGVDVTSIESLGRLAGVRRVEAVESASVRSQTPGAGAAAVDSDRAGHGQALAVVTGACRYPTDVSLPGVGYGAVLHAPAPGATIARVDAGPARAMAGATVVHDGDFLAVVAEDLSTARRAVAAIDVSWNEPSGPPEPELADYLRAHPLEQVGWGGATQVVEGDAGAAIDDSPVTVARTYEAAYIAHVPLETRAAVAAWDGDRLTMWTGTQRPFATRSALALALGVAESDVRVVVPTTGSGFGGKHSPEVAIEAARLARVAGRPVKVLWSREEEFVNGYLRPAAVVDVRGGASSDGGLLGWEHTNFNAGDAGLSSPYASPSRRECFQPSVSPLRQGSYRALAATVNNFARESIIDELAHEMQIDPLEMRLRNLDDERLRAVVRLAAESFGWETRPRDDGIGAGIAIGKEKGGRVATCAEVRVGRDRSLEVLRVVTAFECGAIVSRDELLGQVEGATVMGLGGALFEAVHFAGGRILNARLSAYRVPRFLDVPPIDVVLLDRPDRPAAGAGETPIITIAPAIANAVFVASGLRLRRMPLLPELQGDG